VNLVFSADGYSFNLADLNPELDCAARYANKFCGSRSAWKHLLTPVCR
jgi:hypothetical protein